MAVRYGDLIVPSDAEIVAAKKQIEKGFFNPKIHILKKNRPQFQLLKIPTKSTFNNSSTTQILQT